MAHDLDALFDWRHKSPAPELNRPDEGGHFRVLFFALGAAGADAAVRFPVRGFHRVDSKRCVQMR